MPDTAGNSPRRIGAAIFLGLLFLGIAGISPYLFDLVVATSPDVPLQSLADQIGAPPTPAQKVPAQVALQEIRKRDQELSTSYGWVNEKAGIARVPLDRARAHVLEKGFPSR